MNCTETIACVSCNRCSDLVLSRTQIVYATPCRSNGLLVIGEAPGKDEDIKGEGFVGLSGKTLDRLLAKHKILRIDYARANICRCRPENNRKPTKIEINSCLPFLAQFILSIKPKVILTVGATPTSVFFGNGNLYTKIMEQRGNNNFSSEFNYEVAHPEIRSILSHVEYIVPTPHTSPLAFNRNAPSGEKWAVIAEKQIATAVHLLYT